MRTKSGLPKRRAIRATARFAYGFRHNPDVLRLRSAPVMELAAGNPPAVRTLSMFCGCGGMDLGFLGGFAYRGQTYPALPFDIAHAYDNSSDAIATYRLNVSDDAAIVDLTAIPAGDLPPADLLLGGFPCQDFSSCGPKVGFGGSRGLLYQVMVDYMRVHQPSVVVGENVPHLAKLADGEYLGTIVHDLADAGYDCRVWRLYCPDYGLPQNRARLFFVCVRDDLFRARGQPAIPRPSHFMRHRSIDWAIDDLKGTLDESLPNQSQYFVATKATAGAGQGDQVSRRGQVAYAVRANPKARVHFHYELPRRLTVRECARLQAFPDEFVFPFSASTNVMQIGNAVPPIVAHAVATEIARFMRPASDASGTGGVAT